MAAGSWPAERIAVSAAFLANGFLIGSWAPQIPLFAARLDLSKPELGLMILAFGLGAVGAMPLVGRMIAKGGSRGPMLALHLAMIAAMPALALVGSVPLGVAAILLAGVTTGGMDVAMNVNAVAVERRMDQAITSACHGFWSIGGLLGATLGGFAIAGLGGTAHGLIVGAVIALLLLPVWRSALADGPEPASAETREATASQGGLAAYGRAVAVGLVALAAMIPEGVAIDWSAIYLRESLEAEAAVSGLAFAALAASMAVLRFAGDGIRNRFGAVRTVRGSAVFGVAGLLLIAAASSVPVALLGYALMGVGLANIVPIAFSAAGNLRDLPKGVGMSVVTTFGYSGILVAPSAIGFVAEHFGFGPIFLGLAVGLAGVALAARLLAAADDRAGA
ncbi:hypothetical protein ASG54_14040 [Aureimonas sp. Leaf460]|nr:hypothetical protein ASG62_02175 [Aureimonas sp. Leaf427]KQT76276.1 hypothetical protein ASG54_14040 [Aureimonas sp. Leaf460]